LLQKARSDAAEQVQRGMQVNADAIAAFAAGQAKP
jgi:hypothetical protein